MGSSQVNLSPASKNGQIWTDKGGWEEDRVHSEKGDSMSQAMKARTPQDEPGTLVGRSRVIKVDGR